MLSILDPNQDPKAVDVQNSPAVKSARLAADPAPAGSKIVSDAAKSRPPGAGPRIAKETPKEAPPGLGKTSGSGPSASEVPRPKTAAASPGAAREASADDFELVLGRRQIASCLFAGTLLIAIFAAGAYFAGKMSTPSCAAASSLTPAAAPPRESPAENATMVQQANPVQASVARPVTAAKPNAFPFVATGTEAGAETTNPAQEYSTAPSLNAPLFASPRPGTLYLQMGALDRNTSAIVVAGLRERGYRSFVAPGPNEKIFRVLVGPFVDPEEYKRIKTEMDATDVDHVARETLARHALAQRN